MRVFLKAGFGTVFKDTHAWDWGEPLRILIGAACLVQGCAREPIQWTDVTYTGPARPHGIVIGTLMPSPHACAASVRAVESQGGLVAAWWELRPDSSTSLVVARSSDGAKTWTAPAVADSSDSSPRGCSRPPPAIAVDSTNHYIHLAYFAESSQGTGVFFAHSMDGGKTFHAPVAIVFGKNPAFVSLAAQGDRVAVAYEDPNSAEPVIGIALSETLGHIFMPGDRVSGEGERARQPALDIQDGTIRIWWSDYAADPRRSATRSAYREGRWH